MGDPRIREALLFEEAEGRLRCHTCERCCDIPKGGLGFCNTRKNIGGKLYTLEYGDISSLSINPIEKKPLFHFWPGSEALTIGSWGCNFNCPWCQNYDISKSPQNVGKGRYISPSGLVELVGRYGCGGTSISFNEPTLLLEYSLDVFKLAKQKNYYNTYITNGYMTLEALQALVDHGLDAMNIDIKGDAEVVEKFCSADVEKIWRNALWAKRHGVWVEVTTLIIPGVNNSERCLRRIARRIKDELGEETPWHTTRYYPAYKFEEDPTPRSTLERARRIGKEEGLSYVYVGNVPGHPYENTYCPKCNELLIERYGLDITRYQIIDGCCPACGEKVPITGGLKQ